MIGCKGLGFDGLGCSLVGLRASRVSGAQGSGLGLGFKGYSFQHEAVHGLRQFWS